jgi:hypothetical protein
MTFRVAPRSYRIWPPLELSKACWMLTRQAQTRENAPEALNATEKANMIVGRSDSFLLDGRVTGGHRDS